VRVIDIFFFSDRAGSPLDSYLWMCQVNTASDVSSRNLRIMITNMSVIPMMGGDA